MNKNDVVFRLYKKEEHPNPDTFCHYGWEGTGCFAFWKFATAYYDSAEILFEKFQTSAGDYAVLDGIGVTMCFMYRHFVELSLKYFYVKYVSTTEDEFKAFLNKGHRILDLWYDTKPTLSKLRKRVGSSVDLGVLEHYIDQFDKFDNDSMTMRYPIQKNLEPMSKEAKLDIFNLHDRVKDLYLALDKLDCDLGNQLKADVSQDKIDVFLSKYRDLLPKVQVVLNELKPLTEKENVFNIHSFLNHKSDISTGMSQIKILKSCSCDELIMLDSLYYLGRATSSGELNLPKNPHEAKRDAIKFCVLNMGHDHLEFGKPINNEINIYGKKPSSITTFVYEAIKVIDWDKQDRR